MGSIDIGTTDDDKEAGLQGKLTTIRQRFLQRTRCELPLLLELLERTQAGDSTGLAQLHIYAHRIHGSGAIFEFAAISESAGQFENLLEILIGTSAAAVVEPHDLRRLMKCGRRLAREIGAATTPGSRVNR